MAILLLNCETNAELDDYMVGKWQTDYLKINFKTFNQSDTLHVMEDKFDNNPERIAQSEYFKDGTFNAWFLDRGGEQQGLTNGTWKTSNDTLFTSYSYLGKNVKAIYKVKMIEKGFEASSLYDWDNDGEFDDELLMITKRILE